MIRRFWTRLVRDWDAIGHVMHDARTEAKPTCAPGPDAKYSAENLRPSLGELVDPRDTTRDGW